MSQPESQDSTRDQNAHISLVVDNRHNARSPEQACERIVGIDDEEKARAIAENDLQGSRKQASNPYSTR